MIYLDNAATTRPCEAAVQATLRTLTEDWGNPSSVHRLGISAARLLQRSRQSVAAALGAQPERVFFTSCGTEADNWAIFSGAERMAKRGRHAITTAVEHHAVLNPMKKLEERGFEVTYLQPDALGRVTLEQLQGALRKDTVLVSIMMVNNESGAVMPIEKMAKLTHRVCPDAIFHTDAVQGFFKVPFRASTLGADAISVSGHKIHASKGVGALYLRPGLNLPPLIYGGGQESKLRSGTEMLPLIAGFAAGLVVRLLNRLFRRIPQDLDHIKTGLLVPLLSLLFVGWLMLMVVNPPLGRFNRWMSLCLSEMQGGSRLLLGALLGGMMATDYGGPINKAAYVSGTLALVDLQYDLMAAVMAGGMVPPLGLALACMLFPTRFTASERRSVPQTAIMGLSFVTEGALPFSLRDPLRVGPSCIAGSALAGFLAIFLGCKCPAPHGGLFLLPVMGNPLGFLGALLGGSLLAALLLGLLKKPLKQ